VSQEARIRLFAFHEIFLLHNLSKMMHATYKIFLMEDNLCPIEIPIWYDIKIKGWNNIKCGQDYVQKSHQQISEENYH